MKKDKLFTLLDSFLDQRKKSTGSWAPVTQEEINDLYKIVNTIISLKYQQDLDGDLPVEITIVDRTKTRGMHFRALPYSKFEDEQSHLDEIDIAEYNASIANDDLSRAIRLYRDFKKGY